MKYTIKFDMNLNLNDAVKALDNSGVGFLAFVDNDNKLLGILTDGDLRRGVLNREMEVYKIINKEPIVMDYNTSKSEIIDRLKCLHRRHMPLVDSNNVLKSIFTLDEVQFFSRSNEIFIMAGGLGSRLGNLTKIIPKPMLTVGDRPILQHLVEQFRDQGFRNFTFCVNYKKEMIINFFGDGKKFGVRIKYIIEKEKLGTAGALSLVKDKPDDPFIVINADVLTSLNFEHLIESHIESRNLATMCIRKYSQEIPYGVIKSDCHSNIIGIEEKPSISFDVNTGIYVFDPSIINFVPLNKYFDMPTLFEVLLKEGVYCGVFELIDYWLDIGKVNDYKQANVDLNYN